MPTRVWTRSGMYATQVGCFRNSIPLPEDAKTLARCFKEAGYQTGYIGKWHLATQDPVPERERGGYDYWLASQVGRAVRTRRWKYCVDAPDKNGGRDMGSDTYHMNCEI